MLQVGTPPQNFPAAIDSGSGDLDIAGKGCVGCVTTPPNNGYDPTISSTSSAAFPYKFSNTYETCDLKHPTKPCTIAGKLYHDQVSFAGLGPVQVKLGSIQEQDTNFDQFKQIDGVVGFTGGGRGEDVFGSLVAAGLCDNVWAICMSAGHKSNGTLTLGGVDPRLSDGPIAYVPDAGHGFHSVAVASFILTPSRARAARAAAAATGKAAETAAVASAPVASKVTIPVGQPAILDTGTNVLLLPPALLSSLASAMCADASLAHCTDLFEANKCFALSESEVDAYPDLSMQLDGTTLMMTARDYLLLGSPLAPSAGQYCIGIRSGGNLFIIGDTTMQHYYLVFDLEQQRIGWGNVSKSGCGSVEEGEVR